MSILNLCTHTHSHRISTNGSWLLSRVWASNWPTAIRSGQTVDSFFEKHGRVTRPHPTDRKVFSLVRWRWISVLPWMKVKINMINSWCILMFEAVTMPSLMIMTNSFWGIACEGHTHICTQTLALSIIFKVVSDFENKSLVPSLHAWTSEPSSSSQIKLLLPEVWISYSPAGSWNQWCYKKKRFILFYFAKSNHIVGKVFVWRMFLYSPRIIWIWISFLPFCFSNSSMYPVSSRCCQRIYLCRTSRDNKEHCEDDAYIHDATFLCRWRSQLFIFV